MNAALAVIIGFLALAIGLALRSRRGRDMDLEQWTVGGRASARSSSSC
jgi:solute:Na+ symporter, SSS family